MNQTDSKLKRTKLAVRIRQSFVLFLIIAVFLILEIIVPDRTKSGIDGTKLTEWPQYSRDSLLDGSYTSSICDYVRDQFPLRDALMTLQYDADRLSGKKERNGVYLGRDGHLLAIPVIPEEGRISATAGSINVFAESNPSLKTYCLIVPDAAVITKQYVPALAPVHDQLADIDALHSRLGDEVVFFDAAEALKGHVNESIYYRSDHRWTSKGARYVFESTLNDMQFDTPNQEYSIHTVSSGFQGSLASATGSGLIRDLITVYTPQRDDVDYYVSYPEKNIQTTSIYMRDALKTRDQYDVFLNGENSVVEIFTTAGTGRNLLMVRDSFASTYIQFLYPYFDQIILVDPATCKDKISTMIQRRQITDVMFLFGADTLFSDDALTEYLNESI